MDPRLPIGTNYCKCPVCGEFFTGEKAFTRHRVLVDGERVCMAPVDMLWRGYRHVLKGDLDYWGGV